MSLTQGIAGAMAVAARTPVLKPSTFAPSWSLPFNVFRTPDGYTTDFDITRYAPSGKTYYVTPTGSNANDGLTEATALASVFTALQKVDVDVIRVKAGLYDRNHGWGTTPTRNVSVIGYGGTVTLSAHEPTLAWAADGANPGAYKVTRSAVQWVYDTKVTDGNGDYQRLTKRNSAAEVAANAGSWYTDGTSLWVRLSDDRAPDSLLRVYLAIVNGFVSANVTVYVEGINFEGNSSPFEINPTSAGAGLNVYFKNCQFKYATVYNGLTAQGASLVVLDGCTAAQNYRDGFNYHVEGSITPKAIEINCVGRDNGFAGDDINNGSTIHDGGSIVRIGGKYYRNDGPNVVDVNTSQAWNVGCLAYASTGGGTQNVNYYIDGELWLEGCVSHSSTTDLLVSPGTMHVRNVLNTGKFSVTNGTILPY